MTYAKWITFTLVLLVVKGCDYPEVPYIPNVPITSTEKPAVRILFYGRIDSDKMSWHHSDDSSGKVFSFDKSAYPAARHIYFEANFRTVDPSNFAFIRLMNASGHRPVPGTTMSHSRLDLQPAFSENLYDVLPAEPVDLYIEIRSENGAPVATGWNSYLVIE